MDDSMALHRAAENDQWESVKSLVEKGADVNAKDELGRTVLHIAASSGNLEVVKWLVEHGKADANPTDKDGRTVLDLAGEKDQWEVVKFLLDKALSSHVVQRDASESDKLVVKGDYIKLSEICTSIADRCKKIKSVEIFALNAVFIDQDLIKVGDKLQVAIIAPKWYVVDTKEIVLDGAQGAPHLQAKAEDGAYPGDKGEDGKPGLPGGAAGSFLGIGSEFINGKGLTISANGGKGGSGQDGGNGAVGYRGEDPDLLLNCICDNEYLKAGKYRMERVKEERDSTRSIDYYNIYGTPGGVGGDGGDGGKEGTGGKEGVIRLFELYKESDIKTHFNSGQDGVGGVGGKGGTGGDNGKIVEAEQHLMDTTNSHGKKRCHWEIKKEKEGGTAQSGKNAIDSHNYIRMKKPEDAVEFQDPSHIINNYKNYLRDNLSDSAKKQSLSRFFDRLDNNHEVRNIYDTLGLANELQGLENQFYRLRNEIEFLPFYQSLLKRINEYVKNRKQYEKEKFKQYTNVLDYLYTAISSKIYRLKDRPESNLIVNIEGYLDVVVRDIEELQAITNKAAVNEHKKVKDKIDQKIIEANKIINKQLMPEIEKISNQIDKKIDILIKEIIELQRETETEKQELIKKQRELEDSLALGAVLLIFRNISEVVAFLGSWSAAVGKVIEVTGAASEFSDVDGTSEQKKSVEPQGVKFFLKIAEDSVKHVREKRSEVLGQQLDILSQERSEYPDQLADTEGRITEIKTNLTAASTDYEFDFEKIGVLEDEFKQELTRKQEELSTKANERAPDEKVQRALKVIQGLSSGAQVADISVDVYLKYKDDQSKLNEVSNAIQQAQDTMNKLKEYEDKIHNIMIPMLTGMRDDINDLESKLNSESQVALEVYLSKWQVQSTIKNMKSQMQQITKGFEAQENLVQCMEKLDEAMSALINIYDRIQNYHEQKTLADYIAHVSSVASNSMAVNDKELSNTVTDLDITMKSNIVLVQCEKAINGVKQFVFPFADYYFGKFNLPPELQLDNLENLVHNAVKIVKSLRSTIRDSRTSITKYDRYVYRSDFSSEYISSRPFFKWENERYKDTIAQLLAGKKVTLKADITNGFNANAIKFNVIETHFKAADEAMQKELDEELRYFSVSMTHLGNSYYRCSDKFYIITSDSPTVTHSFGKDKMEEPMMRNGVYNMLKNGDSVLSPYATWRIKLAKLGRGADFSRLRKFENQVDVELVGKGYYVDKNYVDLCNSKLENYYKVDNTVSEIKNFNIDQQNDQQEWQETEIENMKSLLNITHIKSHPHHHHEVRRHRSVRAINEDDESVISSNAAGSISSPINNIINWITSNLLVVNPVNQIQDWLIGGDEIRQSTSDQQQKYFQQKHPVIEPTAFYRQIDSVLVLAPVILHLWQKNFNKISEKRAVTLIDVTSARVRIWQDWLDDAQELMQILEKSLGTTQAEVREFAEALEARREDINAISQEIKVDSHKIEELEKNLIAFQIDLRDDIKYNKAFAKMKHNKFFVDVMIKLTEDIKELPEYERKLNLAKLNYSKYNEQDEEQIKFLHQSENLIGCEGVFDNSKAGISENYNAWNIDTQQDANVNMLQY